MKIRTLALASLLALTALAGSGAARAQSLAGQQPELILSKGTMLHQIADPAALPHSCSAIADDHLLVPVPAGKILLRFKDKSLNCSDGRATLAITQDGLWGYIPDAPRLYADENKLRDFYAASGEAILVKPFALTLGTPPAKILFGRGEIVTVAQTPDETGDGSYEIAAPPDKLADIEAQLAAARGGKAAPVTNAFRIDAAYLADVAVRNFIPDDVVFTRDRPLTPAEYRRILAQFPRISATDAVGIEKSCDAGSLTVKVAAADAANGGAKIDAKLGLADGWLKPLLSKLGIDADAAIAASAGFTKSVTVTKDTVTEIKGDAAFSHGWLLRTGDDNNALLVTTYTKCPDDQGRLAPNVWRILVSSKYDQSILDADQFASLDGRLKTHLGQFFVGATGTLAFDCYTNYLLGAQEIASALNIDDVMTYFLLAKFGALKDRKRFYGC